MIDYQLQFFADEPEGETNEQEQGNPTETPEQDQEKTPTVEELMAELAKERAAKAKDKAALDKVLKENGEIKKQLRAKQTQQEIDDEAKREAEEQQKAYVTELEDYKKRNEAKERYLLQGMDAELAKKAAEAEVSGDMDELADIQKQHTESLLKAKEAEWKKSRPDINAGHGSGSTMTKEEIMAITDRKERTRLIAENIEQFA